MRSISRRALQLCVFALSLALPAHGEASSASQDLIQQGAAELATQHFEQALAKFEAAVQADPSDAKAVFFQGVALNRLARYKEALAQFQEAIAKGASHPDLAFEMGWSFLGLERWSESIVTLERYEQSNPGRGKTSEFIGRAYSELGQYEKAEAALKEAIRRDPGLKPTALVYLAEIEQLKYPAGEGSPLVTLMEEEPTSPLVARLREQLVRASASPSEGEKEWSVGLSVGGGYNSNVTTLGGGLILPNDISKASSPFTRYTVDASYNLHMTTADSLTAGYGFWADVYTAVQSFDLRDHNVYADYHHAFTGDSAATFKVSNEYTELGSSKFRNQAGVRPAYVYRPEDWATLELAYTAFVSNYYFPTLPTQDRSGNTHILSWTNYLGKSGNPLQIRAGYFHLWNHAQGGDFLFQSNALFAGINYKFKWEIIGDISYMRSFDRYANPNSLAGPSGFRFRDKRGDDVDTIAIQFTRVLYKSIRAYVRYDYLRELSNIPDYNFIQNVSSAGFIVSY